MIHSHNLSVHYPCLFCIRSYFNHIGACFKQNNDTNEEANVNSFHSSTQFFRAVSVSTLVPNTLE